MILRFLFLNITYEMTKSKRSESQDRLSELPNALILVILSLLPMRDVVKTSLLSKRFRDLWTTVPYLNFETDENEADAEEDEYGEITYRNVRFKNFVNRALVLWKRSKILKFKVVLFNYEKPPSTDLDLWLRFAMDNEVEELYVDLLKGWHVEQGCPDTEYYPLQRLYSCLSIRKLSLVGCDLLIDGNIQWDQLKYLKIDGVQLSYNVMNKVLSGTPQLEVLFLRLEEVEDLSIHSSSLKVLTIEKFNYEGEETALSIWAPNVETLEILGDPYGNYEILNVSSLTNATVDIVYFVKDHGDGQIPGYVLLEAIMGHVYQTNHHVEKVTLCDWCIKMLVEMKKQEKHMFEPVSNAKFLKLYGCEVDELMGLLEIFPKLTKLVLEDRRIKQSGIYEIHWDIKEPYIIKFDTDNSMESQTDFPKSCLLNLTTVEIAWSYCNNSKFQIAEFFLENACKLEKLVIWATRILTLEQESLLQKLLKIPRSSPTAEVILRIE